MFHNSSEAFRELYSVELWDHQKKTKTKRAQVDKMSPLIIAIDANFTMIKNRDGIIASPNCTVKNSSSRSKFKRYIFEDGSIAVYCPECPLVGLWWRIIDCGVGRLPGLASRSSWGGDLAIRGRWALPAVRVTAPSISSSAAAPL